MGGFVVFDEHMSCAAARADGRYSGMCGIFSVFVIWIGGGITISLLLLYWLAWKLWDRPLGRKILSPFFAILFGILTSFLLVVLQPPLFEKFEAQFGSMEALSVLGIIMIILFYFFSVFIERKRSLP